MRTVIANVKIEVDDKSFLGTLKIEYSDLNHRNNKGQIDRTDSISNGVCIYNITDTEKNEIPLMDQQILFGSKNVDIYDGAIGRIYCMENGSHLNKIEVLHVHSDGVIDLGC